MAGGLHHKNPGYPPTFKYRRCTPSLTRETHTMDLKKKTTTELKVLQDRLSFELTQRQSEPHVPALQMITCAGEKEWFDIDSISQSKEHIYRSLSKAISTHDNIFNITLIMLPESDYNDKKKHAEI
jgi:hypothetical protein